MSNNLQEGTISVNIWRQFKDNLLNVSNPCPFSKWGIDLIGLIPKGRRSASFAIVAIDYFMKWLEAELMTKITKANTFGFFVEKHYMLVWYSPLNYFR